MRIAVLSVALGITTGVAPLMAGQLQYVGVNLAGAEFGEGSLPGTFNTHYRYPDQDEVDYFRSKCMNVVRLCFRWERLQQSTFAAFDAAESNRFDTFVSQTTAKGVYVILDPHNYARYYGDLIGSGSVPITAFADFWSRLASLYGSNDRVIFGLMNEPHDMSSETWRDSANAAIAAIRTAGAGNLILVPGNGWTGAHSWYQTWYGTANATRMLEIVDPDNNMAFEVHQYLDSNSSGGSSAIVSETIGMERLEDFTQWCIDNNKKGFLGEFAVANSTIGAGIGDEALSHMIGYMQDNADVWLGWTWWAAGPWWGEYQFTAEPTDLDDPGQADRPVMTELVNYLSAPTVSLWAGAPGEFEFDTLIDYKYQPEIATDLSLSNWTDNGATILGTGDGAGVPIAGAGTVGFHRICATCPDQ